MLRSNAEKLKEFLTRQRAVSLVDFDNAGAFAEIDLSSANRSLTAAILNDVLLFSEWINQQITSKHARYGIGGYDEHRSIYAGSEHFDDAIEPRRLHLGIDIWAPPGTSVYAPLDATLHSFQNNDRAGDYGPTIILEHHLDDLRFYTLYGHLSESSLARLAPQSNFRAGAVLGSLGSHHENGGWPSHLHFQVIFDLQGFSGDYPGVCKVSEKAGYLLNCPDPEIIFDYRTHKPA